MYIGIVLLFGLNILLYFFDQKLYMYINVFKT